VPAREQDLGWVQVLSTERRVQMQSWQSWQSWQHVHEGLAVHS
jgi:hypothetical protein